AHINVFDSIVQGGDGVWEGLRVYKGKIFALSRHLTRMYNSAKSLNFENVPDENYVRSAIRETLQANNMTDETHIRLTLTRGVKITSGMDPQLNQDGCTLIVVAEYKKPIYPASGITLATANIRRNSPATLDSKIHHNNLLNNILAKIEGNLAGADDAIMLDLDGFVSETNATNIFMLKNSELHTPTTAACLPGITRETIMELAQKNNISCTERNITVKELYEADEVFTTGTMGELTNVYEIDGKEISNSQAESLLSKFQKMYLEWAVGQSEII
ncbi:MAG: aminotransferase IV, partial [Bacteroidia bacterium]|nr:aminotransferase IV [Bacteroidia bacterium]